MHFTRLIQLAVALSLALLATPHLDGGTAIASSAGSARAAPAPFSAKINFQPAGAPTPAGYRADTGAAYGLRGNGYTYGWSRDNRANTRDRNALTDQRYDTLAHMQLNGTFTWQIAVPQGRYTVRVVAGDPSYYNSFYHILAEGTAIVSCAPTSRHRWCEGTQVVTVNDGKLTIANGASAANNKIDFIEIVAGDVPPTQPLFEDRFDRPDSADLGPAWVQSGWQIRGGTAYNFERGYANLRTAQAFAAAAYVVETRALGFGPLQGPSPSDSTDLVFGGADADSFNFYRVSYFPSASSNRLVLQRLSAPPGEEITVTTLDQANIQLPTDRWLMWKVVRDGPSGLIQVFIDMGHGYYQPIPVLEASDSTYTRLGHFGWVLESESPGDFNVDWIKATVR